MSLSMFSESCRSQNIFLVHEVPEVGIEDVRGPEIRFAVKKLSQKESKWLNQAARASWIFRAN